MRYSGLLTALSVCLLAVGCCQTVRQDHPRHVVFIGFDGLSGTILAAKPESMPVLSGLKERAAWTVSSRSVLPTFSTCNWRSIYSCSGTEQHGHVKPDSRQPVFAPAAVNALGKYPDILSELRRQRPEAKIEFLHQWNALSAQANTEACDYVFCEAERKLADAAVDRILHSRPEFLSVVFDEPDHTGRFGWGSPEYLAACARMDGYLKDILSAVEASGDADETLVVITSDHGGKGNKHGGATLEEMNRPLFILGKNVKRNFRIEDSTTVYDTGATLAWALGLAFPQAWIGRPILSAFNE